MSINELFIKLGKQLIGKKNYDFDISYDHYQYLKAKFKKEREVIRKLNKSLYGKC